MWYHASMALIEPDREPHNADWTKRSWDLPHYKSPEFMAQLQAMDMSLAQFRRLPVYRFAVEQGLIKNDRWVGPPSERPETSP